MNSFDPVEYLIVMVGVGLVPFAVVMMTSFAKIVIVLFLLRQALGIQQTPPNLVLYGISIVLTIFIMAPTLSEIRQIVEQYPPPAEGVSGWFAVLAKAQAPVRTFLVRFANKEEIAFFIEAARKIWPQEYARSLAADNFIVLVPAFLLSELTRSFEIGFMLYLPFVTIDLIVSNILLAMGSMMVSPMMISLPLKLFLFVLVDGWARLIHGLIVSYGG